MHFSFSVPGKNFTKTTSSLKQAWKELEKAADWGGWTISAQMFDVETSLSKNNFWFLNFTPAGEIGTWSLHFIT